MKVELWSRSSGDDEAQVTMEFWWQSSGDDETQVTMELWSRCSRGSGGVDDFGSVATGTGEKNRSRKGSPQFPAAAVER